MFPIKGSLCIILALSVFISANDEVSDVSEPHHWDVLIFTQHWPSTVCHEWEEQQPAHSCSLPAQRDSWTVHGIWPTKLGTIGPQFCNSSWKFDHDKIQPIQKEMEEKWINIEKGTPEYSFWEHEWSKHGTCAAVLPDLDNQMKYFSKGLSWLKQYSMNDILAQANIVPGDDKSYKPLEVYSAIMTKLGKNPSLHCHIEPETKKSYMFEIRICFDKSLQLTHCDGIKLESAPHAESKLVHCDLSQPIVYTSSPIPVNKQEESYWSYAVVEMYRIVKLLQWYTL